MAKQKYNINKDKSIKEYEIVKQQYNEILSMIDVIKSKKEVQLSEIKTKISEAR
jgi:hypothetical protein